MDRKDNSPIVVALLCLLVATSLGASDKSLPDATTAAPVQPDSAEAKWSALVQRRPFPYSAPLPPEEPTLLDGTYTKTDPKTEPRVSCRRCPDYAPEGGLWKIQFDRGVFRIFHAPSGWKSIGSCRVEGNRLSVYNDPVCPEITGLYTWAREGGQLFLQVIEDECGIRLRAENLTRQPWISSSRPDANAADPPN